MTALFTALLVFFIAQGVILDASLLFAALVIGIGLILQGREKRRETTERAVAQAETIVFEARSRQ